MQEQTLPCRERLDVRIIFHRSRTHHLPETLGKRPWLHRQHLVQTFGTGVFERWHLFDGVFPMRAEPTDRLEQLAFER